MKRGILIGLLVAGVIGGLTLGFCRMGHARWRHHEEFRDRVAESCSEAALRVYERERGGPRHHDWDRGRPPHDGPRRDRSDDMPGAPHPPSAPTPPAAP